MLSVTVAGHSGEGKSTLLALIVQCLQAKGLPVIVSDDHGSDWSDLLVEPTLLDRNLAAMVGRMRADPTHPKIDLSARTVVREPVFTAPLPPPQEIDRVELGPAEPPAGGLLEHVGPGGPG